MVYLKAIDGQRVFARFGTRYEPDTESGTRGGGPPGRFVDVLTLSHALTTESVTGLDQACQLFDVATPRHTAAPEPGRPLTEAVVSGALDQANAIARLYRAELAQHEQTGAGLAPSNAYSPGSYAQTMYEQLGIREPLTGWPDFPRDVLGVAMGALYGGESFVGIRAIPDQPVPVRACDFGGIYPIVAALTGAFDLLAAQTITVTPVDLREVEQLLLTVAGRINEWMATDTPGRSPIAPGEWRRLARTFVHVQPDGDVVPHKVRPRQAWLLNVAPLHATTPIPLNLLDALRSLIETGTLPRILDAVELRPVGRVPTHQITLPSDTHVDPRREDPFLALAAERIRLEVRLSPTLPDTVRMRWRGYLKGVETRWQAASCARSTRVSRLRS